MGEMKGLKGLHHLALKVKDVKRSKAFYQDIFGMRVVWEPDEGSVYLSSGSDNLALHQRPSEAGPAGDAQALDHLGFIIDSIERVKELEQEFRGRAVTVVKPFKQHRDGSASFYCTDPDGIVIQVLYEPHLSR